MPQEVHVCYPQQHTGIAPGVWGAARVSEQEEGEQQELSWSFAADPWLQQAHQHQQLQLKDTAQHNVIAQFQAESQLQATPLPIQQQILFSRARYRDSFVPESLLSSLLSETELLAEPPPSQLGLARLHQAHTDTFFCIHPNRRHVIEMCRSNERQSSLAFKTPIIGLYPGKDSESIGIRGYSSAYLLNSNYIAATTTSSSSPSSSTLNAISNNGFGLVSIDFASELADLSLSPFIDFEAISTTVDRRVHWCNFRDQTALLLNVDMDETMTSSSLFFGCAFSHHPRTIIVAQQKSVHHHDLRSRKSQRFHIGTSASICAVARHPSEMFHVVLATSSPAAGLLLYDTRMTSHPLLSWTHGESDHISMSNQMRATMPTRGVAMAAIDTQNIIMQWDQQCPRVLATSYTTSSSKPPQTLMSPYLLPIQGNQGVFGAVIQSDAQHEQWRIYLAIASNQLFIYLLLTALFIIYYPFIYLYLLILFKFLYLFVPGKWRSVSICFIYRKIALFIATPSLITHSPNHLRNPVRSQLSSQAPSHQINLSPAYFYMIDHLLQYPAHKNSPGSRFTLHLLRLAREAVQNTWNPLAFPCTCDLSNLQRWQQHSFKMHFLTLYELSEWLSFCPLHRTIGLPVPRDLPLYKSRVDLSRIQSNAVTTPPATPRPPSEMKLRSPDLFVTMDQDSVESTSSASPRTTADVAMLTTLISQTHHQVTRQAVHLITCPVPRFYQPQTNDKVSQLVEALRVRWDANNEEEAEEEQDAQPASSVSSRRKASVQLDPEMMTPIVKRSSQPILSQSSQTFSQPFSQPLSQSSQQSIGTPQARAGFGSSTPRNRTPSQRSSSQQTVGFSSSTRRTLPRSQTLPSRSALSQEDAQIVDDLSLTHL